MENSIPFVNPFLSREHFFFLFFFRPKLHPCHCPRGRRHTRSICGSGGCSPRQSHPSHKWICSKNKVIMNQNNKTNVCLGYFSGIYKTNIHPGRRRLCPRHSSTASTATSFSPKASPSPWSRSRSLSLTWRGGTRPSRQNIGDNMSCRNSRETPTCSV